MTADATRFVVTGKNIEVTPALRQYAEKRIGKIRKYFPGDIPMSIEVVLSIERESQIAEVTAHVQSLVLRAESRTDDMYASIDACVDRLERQIRRHKTRLQKRFQGSPKLGELSARQEAAGAVAEDGELPKIVRRKQFPLKPMTVEEALMQMDLLGHDFYVFANAATDQVNVLYRRKDGNVGLLEPEYN